MYLFICFKSVYVRKITIESQNGVNYYVQKELDRTEDEYDTHLGPRNGFSLIPYKSEEKGPGNVPLHGECQSDLIS